MLQNLKKSLSYGVTEQGAMKYSTSQDHVTDYFAQGSSLRNRTNEEIITLFEKAFQTDPLTTLRILFYSRDVRGGQGERKAFRVILKHLALQHPEILKKNLHLISEFGRWDDIYSLFDTPLEKEAICLIEKQLHDDLRTNYPSLLAKWLKSENASSRESRRLAYRTRRGLNMNKFKYQRLLSKLRYRLNIIETHLCTGDYHMIEYDKVPAKAMLKYTDAFIRHDEKRYRLYLDHVSQGITKVKSKVLAPYELVREAIKLDSKEEKIELLNAMWDGLPDYIQCNARNNLAVIDVSGSMFDSHGSINMSISLGLYLAEKSTGAFKNHFITFSEDPELVEIKGSTFYEKVCNIEGSDWGYSTNIKRVFDLVLNTAVRDNLKQEDIPEKIFIISDMEFSRADSAIGKTLFEHIKDEYNGKGFKLPKLVFWNVASRTNNIPMIPDKEGSIQLVSGSNPCLFEALLQEKTLNEWDLMMMIIGKERYNCIQI